MKNLKPWDVAKHYSHDISGIENPEKYLFENVNGVFYPVVEITQKELELYYRLDEIKTAFKNLNDFLLDENLSDEIMDKFASGYPFGSSFDEMTIKVFKWVKRFMS